MPSAPVPLFRALRSLATFALVGVILPLLFVAAPVQAVVLDRGSVGMVPARVAGLASPADLPHGWRTAMLARVNEVRASVGLRALRPCAALRRSAQDYAGTMASTSTFAHVGPDGSEPWDRMERQGFAWRVAAENIAAGQSGVDEVMDDWVKSPEHYANLVNPALRQVGFGYAYGPRSTYGTYWVQNFGRGRGC